MRFCHGLLLAVAAWMIPHAATAQVELEQADGRAFIPGERVTHPEPISVLEPGGGWLTAGETALTARCVEANIVLKPYASQQSEFRRVSSKHTLDKALGMSASASAKYYGAKGSASYNMSQTLKLSEENIYVVGNHFVMVSSRVAIPQGRSPSDLSVQFNLPMSAQMTEAFAMDLNSAIPDVGLTAEALKTLKENPSQFLKTCGDSYISGVLYGGVQSVTLILQTKTRDEYKSVSGNIGGGFDGGVVGGSVSLTANETVRKYSKSKRLSILESRTGANPVPSPVNLNELEQHFKSFPTEVSTWLAGDATPILISLRRYDRLSNWPSDTKFPGTWANSVFLAQAEVSLSELLDLIREVQLPENLRLQIQDDQTNPGTLKKAEESVQSQLNLVRSRRSACVADPANCDISGIWQHDLDARSVLPVRKNDTAAWKALSNTERKLTEIKKAVCFPGGPACDQLKKQQTKIWTKRVEIRQARLRVDSINARVDKWLKSINDVRCEGDQAQWGCVNAGVIEDYRSRLLSTPVAMFGIEQAIQGAGPTLLTMAEADTVTVNCVCETKKNPSWCELPMGDFEEISYWRLAAEPPSDPWTPGFTAEYCKRHREDTCLCDNIQRFRGTVGN
ncbi:hypothetical protein [Rhizobium johnstonii]|uniref:hypothetical protein n=1 Tax=Rhizobium johnstonii TaxID=3019933 RepID=UPI003F9D752B